MAGMSLFLRNPSFIRIQLTQLCYSDASEQWLDSAACLYEPANDDCQLRARASSKTTGLALLVIGLTIGAGLVFTLNYTYEVLSPRTITTTWTETSIVVITIPTVITSTTVYVQIQASVTSCQWSGSHEYCEVVLKDSGNLGTATIGNCSLSYGSHTYAGYTGPTLTSAAPPGTPQQLVPGSSRTSYCQASSGGAAGAGTQLTGTVLLGDGAEVGFSADASS
jgi:hypothetical protein